VGVIVVFSDPAARAAQRETQTIPIIAVLGDPIASGLITSLAKPGGNLTGISTFAVRTRGKETRDSDRNPAGAARWRADRSR
jgi:putative ABC transport system substrate-binding protein